jgi:transposase
LPPAAPDNRPALANARASRRGAAGACSGDQSLKTISQKMHRMHAQLVKFRTTQINRLRGLLTEYGKVVP